MEHGHPTHAGAIGTILLAAISWFLNFVSNADALIQLVLHIAQLFAACGAILVTAITVYPPLKGKIAKWFRG